MKLLYKVVLNILMMSATESECKKQCPTPSPEDIAKVFHHMQDIGCCDWCAHMYSGKSSDEFYETLHAQNEASGKESKKNKTNPCISCLGLLHSPYKDRIVDKIISDIKQSDNDFDTFTLTLTLPISYQLRAHSLAYYIKKHHSYISQTENGIFPWINIKDIFKVTSAPHIAHQVNRILKHNSDLTVNVKLTYSNDELECFKLLELCPEVFGKRNMKKFRGFLFSRKCVDIALNDITNIKLRNYYSTAPSVPNHELECCEVSIKQSPMYCAGRYNKYSRQLPQSPWIINGVRRFNTSLQELFSGDVQKLLKAQDYTFSSSGREDVDVRMLGNGRPFSIELINPSYTKVTQKELDNLMNRINKNHGDQIRISHLQLISKEDLKLIKDGEENKKKTYEALCVSRQQLSPVTLDSLSKLAPLNIAQKTPIRVLHRRSNMVRTKTIHSVKATPVENSNSNQTFFTLTLVTQAGTYVKEFVNGDLNRTLPNLRSLLGSNDIDILALDVLNIDLDWPPSKRKFL